ncbi:nucleoid-associated protein YgaU [Allocatelliglobosispora scoriae]|uniref:Nucleoid-associated protein YgaU n=1 Tax=Allocatelliglobosispora scoriae TaxID=643052 RepID=A0A841BKZ7_9ACTN|nr:LysM peptidoglycan-binding domain-containing protein [Allocatelliglobosispora scoriae]MBB5867916.1 nucleoid-associated protein YgaU [Allocatelliglobosispora scoriae]
MTGMAKAYLKFLEPTVKDGPGGSISVGTVSELQFMFNPKEYTVTKSAEWSRKSTKNAASAAMPEFTGAGPRSISVEMFLDATDPDLKVQVHEAVETLLKCVVPLPATLAKGKKPLPPFVLFGWGKIVSFVAFVKSVNAKYTLFMPDGTPLRAVCQLTLEEIPVPAKHGTPPKRQNPTSGSAHSTHAHTVIAGDSLASISYAAYGDATRWRDVAEANDIDDPLRLTPGTRLLLPAA